MKYQVQKDKIVIFDTKEFNPKHILECGQIFRYKKLNDTDYMVFSDDKLANIKKQENTYIIQTKNVDYFQHFFDLNTDYNAIKNQLANTNQTMKDATNFGEGIRLLNQQPFETIISFIISANNNIKRIQGIIERICQKCGTDMGTYFSFPSPQQLASQSVDDLRALGLGFRAEYVYQTTKSLLNYDLNTLYQKNTEQLLEFLCGLKGIGPKVADCIALFAFGKMDCFPVDTWIEKVYKTYFDSATEQVSRKQIRQKLTNIFGNLSGYAQQYLFYYKRELDHLS